MNKMFTFQVKLQVSLKDCNYCKSTILDIDVRLITKLSEKCFGLEKKTTRQQSKIKAVFKIQLKNCLKIAF